MNKMKETIDTFSIIQEESINKNENEIFEIAAIISTEIQNYRFFDINYFL